MTDHKILVSRELLERIKRTGVWPDDVKEIEGLLAQPSYGALTNEGADQAALMPVDRSYDVRAKMIIAFNERKKAGGDLDDCLDAAYKSALRFTPSPASTESRS